MSFDHPDWQGDTRPVLASSLAFAGFYYLKESDRVRCFSCNGLLYNWVPGDQPLVEHARWFPTCPYIIHLMGQTFVDAHSEHFPPIPLAHELVESHQKQRIPSTENEGVIEEEKYEEMTKEQLIDKCYQFFKDKLCTVCMERERTRAYTKCGHLVSVSFYYPTLEQTPCTPLHWHPSPEPYFINHIPKTHFFK